MGQMELDDSCIKSASGPKPRIKCYIKPICNAVN